MMANVCSKHLFHGLSGYILRSGSGVDFGESFFDFASGFPLKSKGSDIEFGGTSLLYFFFV